MDTRTRLKDTHAPALTPRETALLCLIAAGLTTSEAAHRLCISRHTAAQHICAMLRRMGAKSRGELIARAYAQGVLVTGVWPPRAVSGAASR